VPLHAQTYEQKEMNDIANNMARLADRIIAFVDKYAKVSPAYDGTNSKYTNVDILSLLACADCLNTGKSVFHHGHAAKLMRPNIQKKVKRNMMPL